MPYLTLTLTKSKATAKPWFSRLLRHPARKRSGSILGQTHTYLLTYLLAPDPHGARTGVTNPRDFHSLAYKKFQDFSRTFQEHQNIFPNSVVAQQCLNVQTNSSYLLSPYKYTHYSVTVQSTAKRSSQVEQKPFGPVRT